MFLSAVCRNESLDALGHLSSDGCMRPWLPSYANLPKPQEASAAPNPHTVGAHCNLWQPKCSAACAHGFLSQSMQEAVLLPAYPCMDDLVSACWWYAELPHCQSQTRPAMQHCAGASYHCNAHERLAWLHRMVLAASCPGHAPARAPQRGVPAHSARLAASLSRGRRPTTAVPSRSADPSVHQAAAGGARSPCRCLTPQHRLVRKEAWPGRLRACPVATRGCAVNSSIDV